jgi:transaldolase / glucose-6-phosphate isomerase
MNDPMTSLSNVSNEIVKIKEGGQSIWYDNLSRDILNDGTLDDLVKKGITGLTSNPTIFQKAVSQSKLYDEEIRQGVANSLSTEDICEGIFIADVGGAADLLLPVWKVSSGRDGYASLEVSPDLAYDTQGTITAAKRLWSKLKPPNIMIKVPATDEGIVAIKHLLEEGININVTLIFSTKVYDEVALAYLQALETRYERHESIENIASVASFFVSRVDSLVEKRLREGSKENQIDRFLGYVGIANCRIAYSRFEKLFNSDRFSKLKDHGAKVQRPLWASTGTKSPTLDSRFYVEKLIAEDTVNTLPHATLEAVFDGVTPDSLMSLAEQDAQRIIADLSSEDIDFQELVDLLKTQGVALFKDSYRDLCRAIDDKKKQF